MDVERADAHHSLKLVSFIIDKEEYGVPIEMVKEIIRKPGITLLPSTPEYIQGVINLRDTIIPILSMREKFGLGSIENANTKIMIVEHAGSFIGLEVNDVTEVITIENERISEASSITTSVNSDYIAAVGKIGTRLLIILNLQSLLSEEMGGLHQAELMSAAQDEN